jgi:phage terminase large subunit-like protein
MTITITKAMSDANLFEPYLRGRHKDLSSWEAWRVCLKAVYGRPITSTFGKKLVEECTGRSVDELNPDGYDEALLLCGRRSGKSRIAGLVAGYESTLSGREANLDPGELGLVTVVSPTKMQSKIVHRYIEASLSSPMLQREVLPRDREGFELANGVRVQILAGDFRTVRGFSQLCVVADEICFFGVEEESKIRSDTELIRAVRPALAMSVRYSLPALEAWVKDHSEKNCANS